MKKSKRKASVLKTKGEIDVKKGNTTTHIIVKKSRWKLCGVTKLERSAHRTTHNINDKWQRDIKIHYHALKFITFYKQK